MQARQNRDGFKTVVLLKKLGRLDLEAIGAIEWAIGAPKVEIGGGNI